MTRRGRAGTRRARGVADDPRRVFICDPAHPHHGESGVWTGEGITMAFGGRMAKVALDNCKHGVDACYVSPGQIREERRR